jgi:hypothetical protein
MYRKTDDGMLWFTVEHKLSVQLDDPYRAENVQINKSVVQWWRGYRECTHPGCRGRL